MNTQQLHLDIHRVVAICRREWSDKVGNPLPFGDLPTMLHWHMFLHHMQYETKMYVEVNGKEYRVIAVKKRYDDIGRLDNQSITLEVENNGSG